MVERKKSWLADHEECSNNDHAERSEEGEIYCGGCGRLLSATTIVPIRPNDEVQLFSDGIQVGGNLHRPRHGTRRILLEYLTDE